MATVMNFLCAFIFLCLATQGMGQCTLKDMKIKQAKLNKLVQRRPVWNVTVANNCYCSQMDVRIGSDGFRTVKLVDPSSIKIISGGKGIVNAGQPIYPYSSTSFTYAWSVPLQFKLLSSQIVCS